MIFKNKKISITAVCNIPAITMLTLILFLILFFSIYFLRMENEKYTTLANNIIDKISGELLINDRDSLQIVLSRIKKNYNLEKLLISNIAQKCRVRDYICISKKISNLNSYILLVPDHKSFNFVILSLFFIVFVTFLSILIVHILLKNTIVEPIKNIIKTATENPQIFLMANLHLIF